MKKAIYVMLFAMGLLVAGSSIMLSGCTKEGPAGIAGTNGVDGQDGEDGVDGASTCTECHKADGIELIATQFQLSKHEYGEAAFEEAGNLSCTPCHASEAFKYVCENNIPSTFTLNTTTNKYVNDYATISSAAYGDITCGTCHSALHSTYSAGDLALTTVAPVSMTMWGGTKEINCAADGGKSNLCIKCHQPRPFVDALTSNVLDYVAMTTDLSGNVFDGTAESPNTTDKIRPAYRTHTHYGTAGAIFAGKGGVEFPGSSTYTNSVHTAIATCQDCHMGEVNGRAGGHTFTAAGNFKGCNQTDCHADVSSSSSPFWTTPRTDVKEALDALAEKLKINGIEILNRNPDSESNLWAANTTNKYDGYLNIYDPINNPDGPANNPGGMFRNIGNTSSWSDDQKAFNLTLPVVTLTNAQMGSIINFQLCLRDYSLGIHNYKYTMALLQNSLAIL